MCSGHVHTPGLWAYMQCVAQARGSTLLPSPQTSFICSQPAAELEVASQEWPCSPLAPALDATTSPLPAHTPAVWPRWGGAGGGGTSAWAALAPPLDTSEASHSTPFFLPGPRAGPG